MVSISDRKSVLRLNHNFLIKLHPLKNNQIFEWISTILHIRKDFNIEEISKLHFQTVKKDFTIEETTKLHSLENNQKYSNELYTHQKNLDIE